MLNDWLRTLRLSRQFHPRRAKRHRAVSTVAHVRALEARRLLSAVPVGDEFLVNTYTTSNQGTYAAHAVATDAAGNFVVTWGSLQSDAGGYGIYAQRFDASGVKQGEEILVNTHPASNFEGKGTPAIAMDSDGDFVIAWASYLQDGSGNGIFAQRFNATGVKQGGEFQVNTFTTSDQSLPSVAMDTDGDFVITWSSRRQETALSSGSDYGVYAQRYSAAGVAQGGEFHVNTYTTGQQLESVVTMDADGDFVIVWASSIQDGDNNGVYAQRYNAAGVAQGSEFRVNTYTTNTQRLPAADMDADGNFVVAWMSFGQDDGSYGIYGQRYDAAAAAQGGEFLVNTTTLGNQRDPSVSVNADGNFVITWASNSTGGDGSLFGVFGQAFDAAANALGDQFPVNTFTTGDQGRATVALDADGDFVVAWTSPMQDGDGNGVFARQFALNPAPIVNNQTFSIAENRPVGYVVGTVAATDPDGGQLTYAITAGNTGNVFAIDPMTGQITVASATINYEAINQYNLTVEVTDDGSPSPQTSLATITVNITNLNEAPTFLLPTTFTISENRPVGTVVGDVNTVDPEGNTVTYSIVGGDPNAQFAIDTNTGVITVAKATIDFEATPQFLLQVKAQDNGSPANSRTQVITVNINNLNEAPGFLPPTTFAISENRPVGYVVGTVSTTDPEGNAVTYSIVGGDPNGQFAINAVTGQITVAKATIDFETTPQFLLQVKALDNGSPPNSRTQTITVNINNLNEAPSFLPPTTFSVPENSLLGTLVGTVQTVDPEGQLVTYSITGGNTDNAFSINPLNGQIRVANRAALDFETTPQFLLQVKATDSGSPSNSRTQTITINLTNVADSTASAELDQRTAVADDIVVSGGEFRVNTVTTNKQLDSSVAIDADGDFVVTWSSYGQDGHRYGVYAQRYNAAGVAQGSEFRVNTYTTGQQRNSVVAMDATGNFVIAWSSYGQDGSSDGIYAQRYTAAGVAQGGEFQVNTFTTNSQRLPAIAMDPTGDFVIAWQSYKQDGAGDGIYAQRYDAAGMAQGSEFRVNTTTAGQQRAAKVAIESDGAFLLGWENFASGNDGFFTQEYDAAGMAVGGETPDATPSRTFAQRDAEGNYVVVSTDLDSSESGVSAQQFNAMNLPVGVPFRVNTYTTGPQQDPTIAMNLDGDFVITWSSYQDGSNAGIYAQRYEANDPPVVNNQSFAVAENRIMGDVVGTVFATDPNDGPLTYALASGNTDDTFSIDAQTGVISIAGPLTAGEVFNLVVVVTDNGNPPLNDMATVTINVLDATNHAPVFQPPTEFTIAENRPVGYVVGTVHADDPNGNAITYSITGGDPNAQFAINAATGEITVAKATVNFEATPQFTLQVTALDNGSPPLSTSQNVVITVTNLNEPPVFVAPTTFTMSENRAVGYVVGDVNTIDPEGNPVTYAIVGGDGKGQFQIDPFTGVITVKKATIDYEANPFYLLQVKASDNGVPANSRTQTITVNVTNLNEVPNFVGAASFNYAENQPVGSFVGDVNAVDPENNALIYSIVGGNPNGTFAIDATTGVITLAKGSINYEATTQFTLQVKVQDNGSPSQNKTRAYTINITDVNEPPIFVPPTTLSLLENRPVGYVVGTVAAVDPENGPLTYTIVGGNTNSQFAINPNTGQITVAKATIDFETVPQHVLQVKAVDAGSLSATQAITINVTNVNEAPNFLAPTTFSVAENTGNGVVVGTVKTVDPEGNAVTYNIVGGNTNNAFFINPTAGEIIVNNSAALDFETTPQFLLQVKATDNGSPTNSRTQTITINLTNVAGASVQSTRSQTTSPTSVRGTLVEETAPPQPTADHTGFALSDEDYKLWLEDDSALAAV